MGIRPTQYDSINPENDVRGIGVKIALDLHFQPRPVWVAEFYTTPRTCGQTPTDAKKILAVALRKIADDLDATPISSE